MNRLRKFISLATILTMTFNLTVTSNFQTAYADDESVLTSDEISVEGFQIRTSADDLSNFSSVAFRTILKAPKVGSTITVSDMTLKVESFGTVYVFDADTSGVAANKTHDRSSTILNLEAKGSINTENNGSITTYDCLDTTAVGKGYVNSTSSIINGYDSSDTSHVYYAMTQQGMDNLMANTFLVRAFVIATDDQDNEYIVYSPKAKVTSIAKIGYNIYTEGKANNYSAHKYIYNHIVHSDTLKAIYDANNSYPYYLSEEEDYGWVQNYYQVDGTEAGGDGITPDPEN